MAGATTAQIIPGGRQDGQSYFHVPNALNLSVQAPFRWLARA
jgi:hypothetical protein